jgi:arylsulfatase A-like enzyme
MRSLFFALFLPLLTSAAERPNLIWIMADDLGYGELGCYGQTVIQTPHLDQLANGGLRFTHAYAGATVCAPSRSVLMTGQHHGHTRVRGNAGSGNPAAQMLREADVTVSKVLKEAGYATALIGKWGLGMPGDEGVPNRQGFDFFFGFLSQHHAHNHFPDYMWRDEGKIALPNYVTAVGENGGGYSEDKVLFADDLLTDEALKYVALHQDKPFFLYWSPVIPHANNERTKALGDGTDAPDYGPYATLDWPDQDKGQAALVTRLDSYIGRMMEQLQLLGMLEDTLVIFTSDNGPHDESNHDLSRFNPSGPYTGIKRSLTDGGIRVPLLASWEGRIAPGTTTDHVAYFGDWMATAAELAGAALPPDRDSLSFVPTLLGKSDEQARHEFLYWEFHERGFTQAALYQGRWKGIRRGAVDAPVVLYDLDSDVAEQTDVAATNPDIARTIGEYLQTARSPNPDWEPKWAK